MLISPTQNPLLEIGAYKFQDLCRELLEKENDLVFCNDYEECGVPQYGADLLAECDDGISSVIGQCKCYKEFQPAKFKTASTDFLDYLDSHWKPFNIKRFILLLACDAVKANQHTAIREEIKRFHKKGLIYEVWDKNKILLKLRPHPQIVQNYFLDAPSYWLEKICKIQGGVGGSPPQANSGATLSVSFAQVGKLSEIFSGKQNEELERIKELQREGHLREAAEQLSKMRASSDEWGILDNAVKAKILKTVAGDILSLDDDVEKAKELFTEVLRLAPEGDHTTFRTTLEYYEKGAEAALKTVENPKKTDELNQKIGYYLELNESDSALELIKNIPDGIEPDTETKRLHALALFASGKIDEAWVKINQVEEEKPLWEMVQIAKAIIGYYSGLSAAAFPAYPLSWAMPVLWQLVKRDDESVIRFRKAEKIFARVLSGGNKRRGQKLIFESFWLACLANDAERQEEAARYFHDLLAENPAHPFVLSWAQIRGFEFDYAASRDALELKIGENINFRANTQIEETVALLDIYLRMGETVKAQCLLEKTRSEFQKVGGSAVFSFWLGCTAVVENKFNKAFNIGRNEKNRTIGRQIQAMVLREKYFRQKSNNKAFKPLVAYLEKCWRKTADVQCLQKPPMPKGAPNIFGELNFALEMTGSVSDAIIAIWSDDEDLKEAEIRANWVFDNLFVGKYGIRHLLPSNGTDGNGSHEMGVDFSELLAKLLRCTTTHRTLMAERAVNYILIGSTEYFFCPALKPTRRLPFPPPERSTVFSTNRPAESLKRANTQWRVAASMRICS